MKKTHKHKNSSSLSQSRMIRYLLPVFAIVALFLLVACGGGGSTASGGSTPTATTGSTTVAATPTVAATMPTTTGSDSCSYVSATQAGTILGGTVQTHSTTENVGTTQATGCGYSSSTGGVASLAVVTSSDANTAHAAFTQLQQVAQSTSGSKYQVVSGLGDGAFTNGTVLYVLKGKTLMLITVAGSDSSKVLAEEKQFAQEALPKVS